MKGVAFYAMDRVRLMDDPAYRIARVIALRRMNPEPEYELEVEGAGERVVRSQSALLSAVPLDTADCVAWIQTWYSTQCDDDWEHQHGFRIGTLDNPGWHVTIDLTGTDLDSRHFEPVSRLEPEREWLSCKVAEHRFEGDGGPHILAEILRTFVNWARGGS